MSDSVIADNSSVWFPVIGAIQLANWCDVAAVALVCYDSVLMFPREVEYVWKKKRSFMSTFYVIVRYLGIALAVIQELLGIQRKYFNVTIRVAVDRLVNFGVFVNTIVGDIIMAMRIYAMYLGSNIVLCILVAMILARIVLGLVISVVIFGPRSGISATEWILSGIYVCGPSVDVTSSLPFAWDILAIVVSTLLFLLAMGRFLKGALEMRRMLNRWKINDLMGVLARDSIVYFFLNLLATILLMISVWGVPNNSSFFAVISAYRQNEMSVLIPRLVISFRENYDQDGQPSHHGEDTVWRTVRSDIVFGKRTMMTDNLEMRTLDQESPPNAEQSA